jgi:hypothetical protein
MHPCRKLTIVSGRLSHETSTKIRAAGAIAPLPRRRRGRGSADRSGRPVGDSTNGLVQNERLLPLAMGLVHGSYPSRNIYRLPDNIRQNQSNLFQIRNSGVPHWGLPAPSRHRVSQRHALAPTAVESGSGCLYRHAEASAERRQGSCAILRRRESACRLVARLLAATRGREEQTAEVIQHQSGKRIKRLFGFPHGC